MEDLPTATTDRQTRGDHERAEVGTHVRFRWIGVSLVLLIAAAGMVAAVLSTSRPGPSSTTGSVLPTAVAPERPQESGASPWPISATAQPIELLFAVEASLARVAPTASSDSIEMSIIHLATGPAVRVSGQIQLDDRTGTLNVVISTSREPMTCDGYQSCDIGPGRCASTVRRVEVTRSVPEGEPRDLELGVAVRWKDNVFVDVRLNNATAALQPGRPAPNRTGQAPPMTLAQLADFAQEPALNVLATNEADTCT